MQSFHSGADTNDLFQHTWDSMENEKVLNLHLIYFSSPAMIISYENMLVFHSTDTSSLQVSFKFFTILSIWISVLSTIHSELIISFNKRGIMEVKSSIMNSLDWFMTCTSSIKSSKLKWNNHYIFVVVKLE